MSANPISPALLPLMQNCWVVPDIAEAIAGWLDMGIGPFFTYEVQLPEVLYRGTPVPFHIEVAMAQAGPLQIELIKQVNDAPSAYRDVVPAGGRAFHHVCRTYGGYDEGMARLKAQNVTIAMSGELGPVRFCYADTREQMGCMLELVDESDGGAAVHKLVRDGAVDWDGRDPIREIDFAAVFASL